MSVTPPIWFLLAVAGLPVIIGVGWGLSMFRRKVSLIELFCMVTYWAAILGTLYWIR